jgi:hypothetical protein
MVRSLLAYRSMMAPPCFAPPAGYGMVYTRYNSIGDELFV